MIPLLLQKLYYAVAVATCFYAEDLLFTLPLLDRLYFFSRPLTFIAKKLGCRLSITFLPLALREFLTPPHDLLLLTPCFPLH